MRRRHAWWLSLLAACSPHKAPEATISTRPPTSSVPDPVAGADAVVESLPGEATGQGPATTTSPPDRPTIEVESFTLPAPAKPVSTWPPENPEDPWGNDAYRSRILACIRSYEQGADGYATETGNGYHGGFQFDQATWDGAAARAGYPGWVGRRAGDAPPHVQDDVAWQLYQERGLQPWPTPAARC